MPWLDVTLVETNRSNSVLTPENGPYARDHLVKQSWLEMKGANFLAVRFREDEKTPQFVC